MTLKLEKKIAQAGEGYNSQIGSQKVASFVEP